MVPSSLKWSRRAGIAVVPSSLLPLPPADLNDLSESPPPSGLVPHGAFYGSQGMSLHDAAQTSVTSVRIDLTPYKFDADGTPCSLETLGLVPAKPLARKWFGSLSNLRISFKNYPPPTSQSPVVVREVIPGSPAAVSQQLMSGERGILLNELAPLLIS